MFPKILFDEQNEHLGVSKNRGKTPKMDGENNGKPYEQMDDLGVFPIFLVQHPPPNSGPGPVTHVTKNFSLSQPPAWILPEIRGYSVMIHICHIVLQEKEGYWPKLTQKT